MSCKLGVQYQGLGPYKVCSNDDPVFSLLLLYGKMLKYQMLWKPLKSKKISNDQVISQRNNIPDSNLVEKKRN